MLPIPLSQVPNQAITFNADGAIWDIHIYQSINFMCADVGRGGVPIINGIRCFGGIPLLQYTYQYLPNYGNLVFDTDGDWTNFGSSCNLYYLESDEFAQFQAFMAALTLGAARS